MERYKNPKNGGAENFTHELMKRLAKKGYEIFHFSCGFPGAKSYEKIDGVNYHRGSQNILKIIHDAQNFYKKNRPFFGLSIRETHTIFLQINGFQNHNRELFLSIKQHENSGILK